MDKASRIFLGALFGVVAYSISPAASAILYGVLTFIVTFMITS